MNLVPQANEVDGRWSEIINLRKYMQTLSGGNENTREQVERHIDPGRTVDGPTLELLKSPNYPFTLCEEAPASYIPPPVPFDVDEEIARLRDLIHEVQDDLEAYSNSRATARGNVGADEDVLSLADIKSFLNDSAPYMDLAWGISSLQWFHRWVLSHSISSLWTAKEQLEYVLTDNGRSLPKSIDVIEECTKKCPYPMAVDRLEKDRKAVIQMERSRLSSTSRTYRDRVSTSVVTAATSPYLSVEEKYIYQEIYNETEHRLQTLHLARMKDRVSRGNSAVNTSSTSRHNSSLVRSSMSFVEPDINSTTAEALHALQEEEHILRDFIEIIKERKDKNIRFDKSDIERQASRTAQITVYGCLLSDEQLMSLQLNACRDFLSDYEKWLCCYGFVSHDDLMEQLAEFCGEKGKWPATQPKTPHDSHHRHHGGQQPRSESRGLEDEEDVGFSRKYAPQHADDKNKKNSNGTHERKPADSDFVPPPSHQFPTSSEAFSGSNDNMPSSPYVPADSHGPSTPQSAYPDGLVGDATTALPPHTHSSHAYADPTLPSSVAQCLIKLLEKLAHYEQGKIPISPQAVDRMWLIEALRMSTQHFVHGIWNPSSFLRDSVRHEQELLGLLEASPGFRMKRSVGIALIQILGCLCQALEIKCSPTSTYEVVTIPFVDPPEASSFHAILETSEATLWGALLDALWFQVDPSGDANGNLLQSDALIPEYRVKFLNLAGAKISKKNALQIFYNISDQNQVIVYSVREVLQQQLSFVKSEMDRYAFVKELFNALKVVENLGVLSFYACRVEESAFVPLADTIFVYCRKVDGTDQYERFGLLPPAAVELKRFAVGQASQLSPHVYDSPVNFSSIGLQIGDLLCLSSTCPRPLLPMLYYYGETVRENAFWEIDNQVVSHAFVGACSHPLNMDNCRPNRPLSIQRESPGRNDPQHLSSLPAASPQRQLTSAVVRQLADIINCRGQ